MGLNIAKVKTAAFISLIKRKDIKVFTISLKELNDFLNKKNNIKRD